MRPASLPPQLPHPTKRAHLLAMAALRASMGHIGSLSAPTVAEGLNTISAPLSPKPCQFMGWCLQTVRRRGGTGGVAPRADLVAGTPGLVARAGHSSKEGRALNLRTDLP